MSQETFNQNMIDEVTRFIRKVKYGEVVITVHDSKIVQIEKKEKKRYSQATTPVARKPDVSHGPLDQQRQGKNNNRRS